MGKIEIFSRLLLHNSWEDFERFAAFNYFNKSYSVFNSALILLQKPGATIVRSELRWNEEGRFVKPGTPPMLILQPQGPVMPVFDYADTYGQASLNEPDEEFYREMFRSRTKAMVQPAQYSEFLLRLSRCGILYSERSFGTRMDGMAASLEFPQRTYYVRKNRNGIYEEIAVPAYYQVTINSELSVHKKAVALFHELGHLYCGHVAGGTRTEANKVPEFRGEALEHDSREFEAELVSRILCERSGLMDDSEAYLREHLREGAAPPYDKAAVFSAADKIRALLHLK